MKKFWILFLFLFLSFTKSYGQKIDIYQVFRYGNVEEAKSFVEKDKTLLNKPNDDGYSPLILACYRGNTEMVKYLIAQGAELDYKCSGGTALAGVAYKGNVELAKILLESGANPNIQDDSGKTPLFYAVEYSKNLELIKLLLQYKADKSIKDFNGKTVFQYAVESENEALINLLKS